MDLSAWIALGGLALAVVGHIAANARWVGRIESRLDSLSQRVAADYARLDGDLGRLNGKVENDVHGRKAFAGMVERVVRIETLVAGIKERLDDQRRDAA